MKNNLSNIINEAIMVANRLWSQGKVTGSSANLSFRIGNQVYITGTGTSFGTLTENHFSVLDLEGNHIAGMKPSKEYPLHLALYKHNSEYNAVLHTHSFYSTLWSCYSDINTNDFIPKYTPYLEMLLGKIVLVPYAPPGSAELFELFQKSLNSGGYILKNHGPVVASTGLTKALNAMEELEESARLAWELRKENIKQI